MTPVFLTVGLKHWGSPVVGRSQAGTAGAYLWCAAWFLVSHRAYQEHLTVLSETTSAQRTVQLVVGRGRCSLASGTPCTRDEMGPRGSTLPSKQYVSTLSQNLRGFNSAKEAELILRLTERQIWAAYTTRALLYDLLFGDDGPLLHEVSPCSW